MPAMTDATCIELYAAFQTYRQAQPWLVLNPQQPFTIEHPDTGEIAYCCTVDDNTGEDLYHVGIAVYPGAVGFETLTRLQMGTLTLDDASIEAYAVMNDSVMQALLHDPDHKSQPARLQIMVPEDMTWPFWMSTSTDGTTQREPDQRQAKYFMTAFEVAQDLAEQIRAGSVKMPPEITDHEPLTYVLHSSKETSSCWSYHVDVNPIKCTRNQRKTTRQDGT